MADVYTIGELLVEIMRTETDLALSAAGSFSGPFPSGAPAIFIDAVAKLGVAAGMIGAVGNDAFGRCLIDRLRADGVDCSRIALCGDETTGMAFVTYRSDGSREFLFHLKKSAAAYIPLHGDLTFLQNTKVLHISGSTLLLSEPIRQLCMRAVETVKQGGGLVTFDPNVRAELAGLGNLSVSFGPFLRHTDVLLPSSDELQLLTGLSDPAAAAKRLFASGIRTIVQKCGQQGCVLFQDGVKTADVPGFAVNAVDPTGAGDCFDAGVVYGLLQGWEWERILPLANAAGALATTRLGPMEGTFRLHTVTDMLKSV